jgi:hypothetical protein
MSVVKFTPAPASSAGIEGPTRHALWTTDQSSPDAPGALLLHHMAQNKNALVSLCIDHACAQLHIEYNGQVKVFDPPSDESWEI